MDTLATLVLLVTKATNSRTASVACLATNSRMARFSIGLSKCYIKKATEKSVSLRLRQSVSEVSLHQSVPEEIPQSETSVQCSSISGI
jgi:hypothetical protein